MSTTNMAADRLRFLVQNKGESILKMPGSFKAFLNEELKDFPEEKSVIETTYQNRICEFLELPEGVNHELYYGTLADKIGRRCNLHPEWAKWAVVTWLNAVEKPKTNFPLDNAKPYKSVEQTLDVRQDNDPQLKILNSASPVWLKFVMTLIVVSGAFLGGVIGRTWPVVSLAVGFTIIDKSVGESEVEKFLNKGKKLSVSEKFVAILLYILFVGTPSGLCSAFGATLGWLAGKADGRPWVGFAAVFSASFATNTLVPFFAFGCFLTLIISISSCFMAAYKTAVTTS